MSETKSLERLLDKTVKLYNKAIAQKGKGKTILSKAVDKKDEKDYDNTTQYSRRVDEDGREEDRTESGTESGTADSVFYSGERRDIPVRFDDGRVRQLSEVIRTRKVFEQVSSIATEIYTQAKSDLQETLSWHAKNEDLNIYFVKTNRENVDISVLDNNNLFLDENATEK